MAEDDIHTHRPSNDNGANPEAIEDARFAARLAKMDADATAWRGHPDLRQFALGACQTMRRAQAELQALTRQRIAATAPGERAHIDESIRTAMAWLEAASREFAIFETTLDSRSRKSFWTVIDQLMDT